MELEFIKYPYFKYRECNCVGKHVPLALIVYRVELPTGRFVYLCPTSRSNLESLLEEYEKNDGRPAGAVRKHYSDYIQSLTNEIWENRNG